VPHQNRPNREQVRHEPRSGLSRFNDKSRVAAYRSSSSVPITSSRSVIQCEPPPRLRQQRFSRHGRFFSNLSAMSGPMLSAIFTSCYDQPRGLRSRWAAAGNLYTPDGF
jgi:hypothetical protein